MPRAERTCYASWLLCKSRAPPGLRGYTSSCWACMETLAETLRQRLFSENIAACSSKPMLQSLLSSWRKQGKEVLCCLRELFTQAPALSTASYFPQPAPNQLGLVYNTCLGG